MSHFLSIPVGRLPDRHGNRLVLLITLLGSTSAPLLAVLFRTFPEWGTRLYIVVFIFVGLTPVVFRTIQNFTLELCEPADHPQYLGTLGISISIPMLLAPAVGSLIDAVGFNVVFVGMSGLITAGWFLAFGLKEPRNHASEDFWQPVE
jgi:MFS family permease